MKENSLSLKMGVPGLWGSHIHSREKSKWVHKECSLGFIYDIHKMMLRYYSLALVSPLPALGAGVVCLSSATKPEGGYSKDTGPGLTQQHGKGGPNGPVWRKPSLPCSTRGLGWRLGISAIGRPSLVWPQQELLSKGGPPSSRVGWAHGPC